MMASCRLCTARCKAVLPSRSRSLMSTPESSSMRTMPWWPLSTDMCSKGRLSPLSPLSDGGGTRVGKGLCLWGEGGVGGSAV